jgi:hypothetical protein
MKQIELAQAMAQHTGFIYGFYYTEYITAEQVPCAQGKNFINN